MNNDNVRKLKELLAQDMDMSQYVMNDGFIARLKEDREIFGGVLITDFDSVVKHIKILEAYASFVQSCIKSGATPDTFGHFRRRYLYGGNNG